MTHRPCQSMLVVVRHPRVSPRACQSACVPRSFRGDASRQALSNPDNESTVLTAAVSRRECGGFRQLDAVRARRRRIGCIPHQSGGRHPHTRAGGSCMIEYIGGCLSAARTSSPCSNVCNGCTAGGWHGPRSLWACGRQGTAFEPERCVSDCRDRWRRRLLPWRAPTRAHACASVCAHHGDVWRVEHGHLAGMR